MNVAHHQELLERNTSVVNPWNEQDEETVTVDAVDKFKRKLSEFGY